MKDRGHVTDLAAHFKVGDMDLSRHATFLNYSLSLARVGAEGCSIGVHHGPLSRGMTLLLLRIPRAVAKDFLDNGRPSNSNL